MSTIDSIKSALGYPNNAGPIRQALSSSKPLQAGFESAIGSLKENFSNALQAASERAGNANGVEDRQNLPANSDLAAAIFDQVKAALQQQEPVRTALQGVITPEMKAAAADEFHSRAAEWKATQVDQFRSGVKEANAAAIDAFKAQVADWKSSSTFSESA